MGKSFWQKMVSSACSIFLKYKTSVPSPWNHLYGTRSENYLHSIKCRTNSYLHSFYPRNVWNEIGPNLRQAPSLIIFKSNTLKIIRPEKKNVFNNHDPKGMKRLFQLRVGLSPLRHHKKRHNFKDTLSMSIDYWAFSNLLWSLCWSKNQDVSTN